MPIYEYRCEECGELFEQFQKITEEPLKVCFLCGGKAHRIISKSTFILKGTGWYATDYASKDKNSIATTSSTPSKTEDKVATETSEKIEKSSSSNSTTESDAKTDKKKVDKSPVAA